MKHEFCGVVLSICSVSDRNATPRSFSSFTVVLKLDRPRRSLSPSTGGGLDPGQLYRRFLLGLVPNAILLALLAVSLMLSAIKVWKHKCRSLSRMGFARPFCFGRVKEEDRDSKS